MDADGGAPLKIDLNCDMGEGFGAYSLGADAELLDCVTSANVACGFHAGDPATMQRTVRLALAKGVAVGAHPGLPDLQGFGRRRMEITPDDAYRMVLYQIGALDALLKAENGRLNHVKPHGALYNMASVDTALARAVARAVADYDPHLILYGLSGGCLTTEGEAAGLRVAHEVFADRRYLGDGQLAPRILSGAVITDTDEAVEQSLSTLMNGSVTTLDGKPLRLKADTLCIHGDSPQAVAFAREIRRKLTEAGVRVQGIS